MIGAIGKWEVLAHPWVTINCFGWSVFFRAVWAGPETSFLSLLRDAGSFGGPILPGTAFVGRCIELELQAMRIYESLAARFGDMALAAEFFRDLARQEKDHAELLEMCQAASHRGRWKRHLLGAHHETLPRLEGQLEAAGAAAAKIESLRDALRLVVQMEMSEVNQVFAKIVEATDPRLAAKFGAFRAAMRNHLGFVRERIPQLDPELAEECRLLRAAP